MIGKTPILSSYSRSLTIIFNISCFISYRLTEIIGKGFIFSLLHLSLAIA